MANEPTKKPINAPLRKIITFYCRFTASYSAIGFHARKLAWRALKGRFEG